MKEDKIINIRELRQFGLVLSSGLIGIFGIFFPLLGSKGIFPLWPYIAGGIFLLTALINPSLLKIIYIPWMKLGHILGWVNTRIILAVIFYGLITPMGLVMRLFGRDLMQRKYDLKAFSYRNPSSKQNIQHMENPF